MRTQALSLTLALPLLLTGLVSTSACTGAEEQVEKVEAQTVFLRVTADTIDALEPGEDLVVDPQLANTTWIFDGSQGAIDYSRIIMVCPGNVRMPINSWFDTLGTHPLEGHDDEWMLVNDPKDFGSLSLEQQSDMRELLEDLLAEDDGFRAPAHNLEPLDVDGVTYWICWDESAYLCPGGQWEPI